MTSLTLYYDVTNPAAMTSLTLYYDVTNPAAMTSLTRYYDVAIPAAPYHPEWHRVTPLATNRAVTGSGQRPL